MVSINIDSPLREDVRRLLEEHLQDMAATSPAESVHALDHSALAQPGIMFWTARESGELLGGAALKELNTSQGEIKSMRTAPAARGRGIASLLLTRVIEEARRRGCEEVLLETGSDSFFAPARRLYLRHGFTECPPFGDYALDPHSVYMRLELLPAAADYATEV